MNRIRTAIASFINRTARTEQGVNSCMHLTGSVFAGATTREHRNPRDRANW